MPKQWVGELVTVQFQRNALGGGADLPVSPTTQSINGASTSITGTLSKLAPSGLLLEKGSGGAKETYWIPSGVILLVQGPR